MELVADKYTIRKMFKSGDHYGKLCDPQVFKLPNGKYALKAETWRGCADVALIDYETSDFHQFDTEQDAIKAWTGRKPSGCNWNH